MLVSRIWQLSASAASTANSTARLFSTGKAPGSPRQTGQTLVFGAAPNLVEQPQNALVCVSSWTWTSRPITASYFETAETAFPTEAAIRGHYNLRAKGNRHFDHSRWLQSFFSLAL